MEKNNNIKSYKSRLKIKKAKIVRRANNLRTIERKLVDEKPIDIAPEIKNNFSGDKNNFSGDKKLFSILTSAYNAEKYIEDYADSILIQNYRPLELVFINDFSADSTLDKIESYRKTFEQKDIRFRVMSNNSNYGCGGSYKIAAYQAEGFYLGVVDSDDCLTLDAVENIVKLYNAFPDFSYIYTQYDVCDSNMNFIKTGISSFPGRGKSLLQAGTTGSHAFSHWRTFSRRMKGEITDVFEYNVNSAVDKYMGYLLEERGKGLFAESVFYKYRSGLKNSISSKKSSDGDWREMINDFKNKRVKHRISPFEIKKIRSPRDYY